MAFVHAAGLTLAREEIALAITKGRFGSHIGIVFHSAKDGQQLLHLRFHKDLATDPFPGSPKQCWIAGVVNLPVPASKQLVGIVRKFAKRLPEIPFGINVLGGVGSFTPDGSYKPKPNSDGLTCATFVTNIFHAAALHLIQEKTWESDEGNIRWGNDVCAALEVHKAEPEHIAAVRKNINGIRVRPEEVGAAGDTPFKERPINYVTARQKASDVINTLSKECPPPAVPQNLQIQNALASIFFQPPDKLTK